MKKKLLVLLLVVSCLLVLAGCACEHEWVEANCTTPKTCSKCEETEGAPLGHTWHAATCAAPKTCENCGETEGEALPHNWVEADCVSPKTCSDCGATEGEALGHTWVDATYETPKTCSVCAATEGDVLKREDLGYSCDDFAAVLNAGTASLGLSLEYAGLDEDNWPVYYVNDTTTGAELEVAVGFEPAADGQTVKSLIVSGDATDEYAMTKMGNVAGVALVVIDPEFDLNAFTQLLAGEPAVENDGVRYSTVTNGIAIELFVNTEYAAFWIYPAE